MQIEPKNLLLKATIKSASKPADPASFLDADALRALAWVARGEPEGDIAYDSAPEQSPEELALFEPHAYVRAKPSKKA